MNIGTESPLIKRLFGEDFGQEPEEFSQLFVPDYGQEAEYSLEKGLFGNKNPTVQSASSPTPTIPIAPAPKPPTTTVQPIKPSAGALSQRLQARNHPAVQAATQRLNNQGIELEDRMPSNYTADQRAQAIHHVANGVEFMHEQFPGMSDLARNEKLKYTLQGPQKVQGGELMGMYHGNEEQPRIEINNAAEHTLWHEHAHFLDHAVTGYDNVGTRTLGHPLRDFTTELQNHPVRKAKMAEELEQAQAQTQSPALMNHILYRHQPEEVFARFFNSHMHYLHQKHGQAPTHEAYEPEYNEGWQPEHHEYFGPKLRDILRKHELIRSFSEYLDSLNKGEAFEQAKAQAATRKAETEANIKKLNIGAGSTPAFPVRTSRETVHPAVQKQTARLSNMGYELDNKMPISSTVTSVMHAPAMKAVGDALEHVHTSLPGIDNLAKKHNTKITLEPGALSMSGSGAKVRGKYYGAERERARIGISSDHKHTLWHEYGHFIDHALKNRESYATEDESHPLHEFSNDLIATPEHQHFINNTPAIWGKRPIMDPNKFMTQQIDEAGNPMYDKVLADRSMHKYLKSNSEVFARFFNGYMNHLHQRTLVPPYPESTLQNEEQWSGETFNSFGPRLIQLLKEHGITKSFAEYLNKLNKALEATTQVRPPPGTGRASKTPQSYKIPRVIRRPGVRGSNLWWYDEKGNVRYGPKPQQREASPEEPERVKDMLMSEEPWSFVSAHVNGRTDQENNIEHYKLGKELQGMGLQIYPTHGYYKLPGQDELEMEPSFLCLGLTTRQAIPLGRKYGQETVLTHQGMTNLRDGTVAPIAHKEITMGDLPKDRPQSVVLVGAGNHVTMEVETGEPRSINLT